MSKLRLRCRFGLHHWGKWKHENFSDRYWKSSTCTSCGLTISRNDLLVFKVVNICWFFMKKLLGRGAIVAVIFLLVFHLRGSEYFFLLPLALSAVFIYFFPPSVETLYIEKKTGIPEKDKGTFLQLLRATMNETSGVYRVGQSIVVKSYYRLLLTSFFYDFQSSHNMDDYDAHIQSKPKKEYKDHYVMLIRYKSSGETVERLP